MCGRYVMSRASGDLLSYFDAKEAEGPAPPPGWNVEPTDDVPIITENWRVTARGAADDHPLGLVPALAKDIKIGSKLIASA